MTTDRFHKAAKDGLLDVLKETTRREANGRDEAGMTPTLWAAFEGRLEALRLLVGRGGDPDKSDQFGNTALHLAAARGHQDCVSFLVNFGANLFAMDIDHHSAQELASINNRDNILRYLDAATAKLEATDKKRAKAMRDKAKKYCEKRLKEYNKRLAKAEQEAERAESVPGPVPHRSSTVLAALKYKMRAGTGSHGNLTQVGVASPTFSSLVSGGGGTVTGPRGGTTSAVQRRAIASKARTGALQNGEFKVGTIENDGKRSVSSISGVRRDSEVMYVGTFESTANGRRGKIADVFDVPETNGNVPIVRPLARSLSQPDFLATGATRTGPGPAEDVLLQAPASLFVKPGFGSVVFRRSLTSTLSGFAGEELSIGSAGSLAARDRTRAPREWEQDDLSESESSEDTPGGALERFLSAWGLGDFAPRFLQEQIDLDALMLLTENDLKSLGLPLGPHRKLATAIQERKNALQTPGAIIDSRL